MRYVHRPEWNLEIRYYRGMASDTKGGRKSLLSTGSEFGTEHRPPPNPKPTRNLTTLEDCKSKSKIKSKSFVKLAQDFCMARAIR